MFCFNIAKKGDCTISMKDSDFMNMVMGKLGPQKVINIRELGSRVQ